MAFSAQYSPSYLTPFQVPPVGHKGIVSHLS
jgi:hypothetical protein